MKPANSKVIIEPMINPVNSSLVHMEYVLKNGKNERKFIRQVNRIELSSSAWKADALTIVLYLQDVIEVPVGFEPTYMVLQTAG